MTDIVCNAHYAPSFANDFHLEVTGKDETESKMLTVGGVKAHWIAANPSKRMEEYARYVREAKNRRSTRDEKEDVQRQVLRARAQEFITRIFTTLVGGYAELMMFAERTEVGQDELSRILDEEVEHKKRKWDADLGALLGIDLS